MLWIVALILIAAVALFIRWNPKYDLNIDSAYVIDGDTIDISGVRIRLFGIDAPEMAQEGGDLAKKQLTFILENATELEGRQHGKDIYGRTLATLYADGNDVCEMMVETGFALANPTAGLYTRTEKKARRAKKGLWKKGGISSPSAFRAAQ